jgi:hypothetical protein
MAALGAGKAVYVEPPWATTVEESRTIVDTVRRTGRLAFQGPSETDRRRTSARARVPSRTPSVAVDRIAVAAGITVEQGTVDDRPRSDPSAMTLPYRGRG